ncbi:hypothetical protein R69746_06492 [Paraburkholderia aspalathi]|nr:hypothetical protein R69746_06492 [Paraburkholderia aspalathi]
MFASPAKRRKSMAAPGCAVGAPSVNCLVNQASLVAAARSTVPFAGVDWDSPVWDVSETYRHRTRGHKIDTPVQRLMFTRHSPGRRLPGAPLHGVFGDVVKSLVCLRHRQRGQSSNSHMVFVRATRYVFDALADCEYDITELSCDHLDAAAARVQGREKESTAYKVVGHMEEFADALDRNGLCRLRLDWRCRHKVRPRWLTPDRVEQDHRDIGPENRLPDGDAIRALGYLYQHIPRGAPSSECVSGDRIMTLIATIMVCTGLRIGEMLTLPEYPLKTGRDGSRVLRYARLKGRADEICVEWEDKPLLTETVTLVEEALNELHEATEGARQVARAFNETGRLLSGTTLGAEIAGRSLIAILGLRSRNIAQFLKVRRIPYSMRERSCCVSRDNLLRGLVCDHCTLPVIPGSPGEGILLHEALCVCYTNQMHRGNRPTLMYAARPISDQQIGDFLSGRGAIRSVFERYAVLDSRGGKINLRSHGFRHFLNHLLDEGGASDLVQTKWFGRKYEADTRAYQHLTLSQKAVRVVADIEDGRVGGIVPEMAKALPVEMAHTFLTARVQAVHDVGPGMCIHDFQMAPCPKHLQCTVNCDEFIWLKGDVSRTDELKRQAAVVRLSLQNVETEIGTQALVAPDWLRHLRTRYTQLMTQLATLNVSEPDLLRYINEGGGRAENHTG